ncbi:Probable RNA-directed DNA polymerase from transposon BS [Anthophora retusa]
MIPAHQFGFRKKHSALEQIHRIVDAMEKSFEEKKVCTAAFIDVSQAFDRVWHPGLLFKLKINLPHCFYKFFESYLSERYFRVKYNESYSSIQKILAGVPQGSVLGPILYQIYTVDLPQNEGVITGTFADDTAAMAIHEDPNTAAKLLQENLCEISKWAQKWKLKINASKSAHIVFTYRRVPEVPIIMNGETIPTTNEVKYLGMHLDKRLTWKPHLTAKRKQIDLKLRNMYWLIGYRSPLSLFNKLLLYKATLIPIWTYGIQLWGCAKQSNINIIQRVQNKILRTITCAPWYIRNETLHYDLNMKHIRNYAKQYAKAHNNRLQRHSNKLAKELLEEENNIRRLQRTKPNELAKNP